MNYEPWESVTLKLCKKQNFNYSVRSFGKLAHCTTTEVCTMAHKHKSQKPYAFQTEILKYT